MNGEPKGNSIVAQITVNFDKEEYLKLDPRISHNLTNSTLTDALNLIANDIRNVTYIFCELTETQQLLGQTFKCKGLKDFIIPHPGLTVLNPTNLRVNELEFG